jgi:hypothetical protein
MTVIEMPDSLVSVCDGLMMQWLLDPTDLGAALNLALRDPARQP